MQNDHDDKYEPHEESEYHFSDEEVTYEAEPEMVTKTQSAPSTPKESILKQFTQRRLVISGIVFAVLVFAVYKMVTPSTTTQPTDFTPVAQAPAPVMQPQAPIAPAPAVAQAQPTTAIPQQGTTPEVPAQPAPVTQTVVQQPPSLLPQQTQTTTTQTTVAQPPVVPEQQVATTVTTTTVPNVPSAVPTMPGVIPVQTTITTPGTGGLPVVNDQALTAKGDQLSAQVTAAVEQKLNEFSSLNQALQSQVQQLNSRVGAMETQLNQLVNVLTQQQSQRTTSNTSFNVAPQVQQPPVPTERNPNPVVAERLRVPFNVQAIIPGRAWLKSENGETLTVAEGDVVRDVGRVIKIDPYDGVVEINTGSRVVSLSYGNTG